MESNILSQASTSSAATLRIACRAKFVLFYLKMWIKMLLVSLLLIFWLPKVVPRSPEVSKTCFLQFYTHYEF